MAASTVNRSALTSKSRPMNQGNVANIPTWIHTWATTSLDDVGDTVNYGYIPANAKLLGFFVGADDVDSATSFTWKVQAAGVDVHTGLTIGQAASNLTNSLTQFIGIKPLDVTADTLISAVVTAAAGTPVSGQIWITPVYTQL